MAERPPFIISSRDVPERAHKYPGSDEAMAASRAIGAAAGLKQIGLHLVRILPGERTSYPHAESGEEEFCYVIEGEVGIWTDGVVHVARAGDLVAWPAGTGICHTVINDSDAPALLLAGGETDRAGARIYYPLNPERRAQVRPGVWWDDWPAREMGPHDGKPRRR